MSRWFRRRSRPQNALRRAKLSFEKLESRALLAANITTGDVDQLLRRAVASSATDDAIIAVVDRNGAILGVQVEAGVTADITDPDTLYFAIDGAVAEARTAAYFSSNQAPLTSRTVRFISQSTITQREVQANPNPNETDPTLEGPGFVAPIGIGGQFPPGINNTALAALFGIEDSNRAVLTSLGPDGMPDTADDVAYNIDPAYIPAGVRIPIPYAYGQQSGLLPGADNRGIGTLPGGIPLYKNGQLVGGIGVFFPGMNGFADTEQGFNPANPNQTAQQRENAPLALEAEWMAFAAAGGSAGAGAKVGKLSGVADVPGYSLPYGHIFLAGISLEIYGPNPGGPKSVLQEGSKVGRSTPPAVGSGSNEQVLPDGTLELPGTSVSSGWLVTPHTDPAVGGTLAAAQITQMIDQAIATADKTRAAIRLPLGRHTDMVFAVTGLDGDVLGLYRMPDATVFSIDVAIAKARNDEYYSSSDLQDFDRVPVDDLELEGPNNPYLPLGTAFTSRTFRFLADPRYPEGVNGSVPGAFSILNEEGVNPANGYNVGAPESISDISTVLGYDAFHPGTNFHDPNDPENQNGVVFFPGSSPVYAGSILVGGFGASGDGVDQDDVVAYYGVKGFAAPVSIQADQYFVRGVRLPYQEFSRNPFQL
jgi:uncharacterized protein GlcG (DUF336 family)